MTAVKGADAMMECGDMTDISNDNPLGELREYGKLEALLRLIPKKAQHGLLKSCDLILTCLDADELYIALGTNVGLTFLYNRKDESMQRLRSLSTNDVITSIRLHQGLDHQVATATASGDITIFFIPGPVSVQTRQVQKFEVKDIHKCFITCLEWSTNGMKLYSGDKKGQIVETVVDFYEGHCSSTMLLIEQSTEITQLDYNHKNLLVSTRQRSFIVRLDRKCEVIPVGSQDRKMSGPFGACFIPGLCKVDDATLYAARPGCRLWVSDIGGVVKNTHIFSDPLSPAIPEISLLYSGKLQLNPSDFQFGNMKLFREKDLVTWSNSALVVLDPTSNKVIAHQCRMSGIVDVAVTKEMEIFLLRRHAESRVIRISDKPEPKLAKADIITASHVSPLDVKVFIGEEKEAAGAKGFFFKTFSNPLKKLDHLINDSKKATETPLQPQKHEKPAEDVSPELPPVVRLASPELEGLRVFTGGAPLPGPSASDLPITDPPTGLETTVVETRSDMSEYSAVASVSNTMADSENFLSASRDYTKVAQSAPSPFSTTTSSEGIVFSHRMKKHRKNKHKDGWTNKKEEDTISQQSVSSQQSDDSTSVPTPHTEQQSSQNSSLDALKRADDMLKLIDSILNKDSEMPTPHQDNQTGVLMEQQKKSEIDTIANTDVVTAIGNVDTIANSDMVTAIGNVDTIANSDIVNAINNVGDSSTSENVTSKSVDVQKVALSKILPSVTQLSETQLPDARRNVEASSKPVVAFDYIYANKKIISDSNSFNEYSSIPESDKQAQVAPSEKQHNENDDMTKRKSLMRDLSMDIVANALATLESDSNVCVKPRQPPNSKLPKPQPAGPRIFRESGEFQDIYSEVSAIEATDPFRKGLRKLHSVDDFYSNFIDTSPESPEYSSPRPVTESTNRVASSLPPQSERTNEMKDIAEHRVANTWSEFNTPANIYSLVVSRSHIWFTDKSENIYYSSVGNPKGILWRKASGNANQISVSPSGFIVWRLYRNVIYAGTKISSRHPEGLKWVEAVRDVEYISVGDNCAWYIKRSGEVMIQRSLSQERPCYRSKHVECAEHRLKQIHCSHGVVWAITEGLKLLVRTGVSGETPEGLEWEVNDREMPPYLFSSVAIDDNHIGWAIDVLNQIWFCNGVTQETPHGNVKWWQVPMSEYIIQDETTLDTIRALASKFDPTKLSYIMSTNRGGLITSGVQGVWLALDFRNVLQVCRGSMLGYHWLEGQPEQMSSSSCWRLVCANICHLDWGLTWALHINKELYTFKGARAKASVIPECHDFCCISIGPTAVWALTPDGEIKIREGMSLHCPQGSSWVNLDLSQLGDTHIVHLSCNSLYVWVVESEGVIYQCIGAKAPSQNNLSPVWLPIDTFAEIVFTRVHTGPLDWMVWAIDNRRLTYVRAHITENMPIGLEWVHVPGIQSMDLALTNTGVWALTPNGEIYFRYGISRERPAGNYWKKIPGTFIKISASAEDELWGINTEGQLMQCSVRYLMRTQELSDPLLQRTVSVSSTASDEVDWEFV